MSGIPTSQIRAGDIVLTHGMRVRIDSITTYQDQGTVYACRGTVVNLAEVRAEGFIPRSFLYDTERDNYGPGHGREDYWTVQGNDLATWVIEHKATS